MIFLGMDHGTSAIRFAVLSDGSDELVRFFEIPRQAAGSLSPEALQKLIEDNLGMPLSDIDLACLTYSMGDGISQIEDIRFVQNRGVSTTSGVGQITNAGTKVFDIFAKNICPAVLLPGLHQNNPVTDSRMQHFSHQASPEKISTAFHAFSLGYNRLILSDIGSNTVTLAVSDGKILGALDAPIFAPGRSHGPFDVNAIRDIDAGKITANEAFSNAGVGDDKMKLAFFAAMEISALDVLMKEYGDSSGCSSCCDSDSNSDDYTILVAGSGGEDKEVRREISRLLQKPVESLGKWSAALGCAEIAKSIVRKEADSVFGIPVHFNLEEWMILRGYGLEQ
ncbi:methanogenesis marker 12 protein [Methanimicrococcus sp. OttesenSCG-928-J09]|nr:methanogenesis marker 12 protein [Methanimicrococcus sp. OttesenSCG-928-J09]